MDWQQILLTVITSTIPAIITYLIVVNKSKTDLKKIREQTKEDINKLIKEHEINLDALKEQHKMQMESKEKEQEYKLQIMQKEYELQIQVQQQAKTNDVMTNVIDSLFTDILSDPLETKNKMYALKNLGDSLNNIENG